MAEAPETPEVPRPLTAEEQDEKFVQNSRPLLERFNALEERQKLLVLAKYFSYYGGFPTSPTTPQATASAEEPQAQGA